MAGQKRKESPDDDSRLTKRPRPDRQSPLGVALFEDSKVSNEGTPAFANAALATNDTSDEAKQTKDGATQEFAMSLSSTINRRSYKRRRLPRKGSSQANQGRLSEQRTAIPAKSSHKTQFNETKTTDKAIPEDGKVGLIKKDPRDGKRKRAGAEDEDSDNREDLGDLKVKKRRFESCRPNTITVEEMGVLTRDSPIVKQSSDKLATQAPNPSITDVKGQSPTIIETDGGEPGTPTHNGLRKSKQVLDTEFAHQHEERTDSPLFVGGEQNFGARSRRKRLLKKPSYLSVAGIQKSQLKMTAEGRSAPFGAAADDLPVGHKLLTESISMPSSQPQQAVKKSHDYRSATFMAAADESLEPSRNASSKVSVNDYSQIPAVLPVTISTPNPPLQPGIANQQSDHTEETRSAPLAAAADNPSNFTSPGETQKCMDHNHGDHKVPPSTDPVSSTTSQTATTPPISLLGGPSNQCRKDVDSPHTELLRTPESVETSAPSPPPLPGSMSKEELEQYCINNYKHLSVDLTSAMMPNKSETSGNADSTTEDDPIGDDEDYSDGITEDTCPTWQTAFEDRMNDINGMLRTCDKPFKIPKDYRQAAKQFRRFEKFQQNAKGLMLRYREALDKTRYAADGSLRTELVGEDRQHYWHPFKGEKVYSERLAHEPPMIPVPHYSGYFEEEEEEPLLYSPPRPPPPPRKPKITPVSNHLFDLEAINSNARSSSLKPSEDDSIHGGCETKLQGNGHLDARRCEEKTCDRHLANPNPHSKNNEFNVTERDDDEDKLDTRCPRCLISYNDKPETDTEGAVDKYRNASGASKGSERNTNNKTCRGFSEDRKGENPRGKTKISERDRMDTRTAIFEMVLLRYEKHKHIKKKWDGEERLKECADYVRAAYRMVEASLKGSLEEMPKLRPGLTDYEIVELAGEDGLLLEITSELKIRLDGAEGLLMRSGMDEVKDHHGKFSIF